MEPTTQEKIEWLGNIRKIAGEIRVLAEAAARWRSAAERTTAQWGQEKTSGGEQVSKQELFMERLDGVATEAFEKCREYDRMRAMVSIAIERLSDPEERAVLRGYYIDGQSWEQVARLVHADRSTVIRRRDRAVEKLPLDATVFRDNV